LSIGQKIIFTTERLCYLWLTNSGHSGPQTAYYKPEYNKEATLEKELQDLVEQLGNAIDDSIADSGRIGEIVREMEQAGYDLTLVLEATMRFTPKGRAAEEEPYDPEFDSTSSGLTATARFDLTPQDEEFLQGLKVAF
jgi:hypothetical protein